MTIDDVIAQLTKIVDEARTTSSRLGYFAALYRKVTIQVKRGILQGQFRDGPRMEKLDVVFASTAWQKFFSGSGCGITGTLEFATDSRREQRLARRSESCQVHSHFLSR